MGSHTRNVLTVNGIKSNKAAKLRDGGGLWLVTKGTGRYWIFDYRIAGKRREMGIGPLHTVGLADARQRAEEARALVRQGIDPINHRRQVAIEEAIREKAETMTFGKYADSYIDAAVKAGRWRGAKTEAGWRNTLTNHAAPIRDKPLADIGVQEVLSVIRPLWGEKQETAEKLRERLERVLDAAKVEGLRTGENPAVWRGHLEHLLHKPDALTTKGNHASMPWKQVPALFAKISKLETISAEALMFTILTAARSGEVRGAVWNEIDLENKVWIIPAAKMKAGREHRVPLSDAVLAILDRMKARRINDFIFPGAVAKKPMSANTMAKTLGENDGTGATVHGFRASFRTWLTDATDFDGDLGEMALAHVVGDAVARAYARSDALEKRRELMDDWATFCTSPQQK